MDLHLRRDLSKFEDYSKPMQRKIMGYNAIFLFFLLALGGRIIYGYYQSQDLITLSPYQGIIGVLFILAYLLALALCIRQSGVGFFLTKMIVSLDLALKAYLFLMYGFQLYYQIIFPVAMYVLLILIANRFEKIDNKYDKGGFFKTKQIALWFVIAVGLLFAGNLFLTTDLSENDFLQDDDPDTYEFFFSDSEGIYLPVQGELRIRGDSFITNYDEVYNGYTVVNRSELKEGILEFVCSGCRGNIVFRWEFNETHLERDFLLLAVPDHPIT